MQNKTRNYRDTSYTENFDFYATQPRAVELLLEKESFSPLIWEPACGEGHISKVLERAGYTVLSTDLIDRGYGQGQLDFLRYDCKLPLRADIITNPPYKYAKEFVQQALTVLAPGHKVAMFLKLQFLEGQSRRALFHHHPPQTVYVSSARLQCAKNGVFRGSSTIAFAWFVWYKGYHGATYLKWIN